MYNPCIGDCGTTQMFYPLNQFAQNKNEILNLDQASLDKLDNAFSGCGLTEVRVLRTIALDSSHDG